MFGFAGGFSMFGPKAAIAPPQPTPDELKEKLKSWQKDLKKASNELTKNQAGLEKSIANLKAEARALLNKNQPDNARLMCKQIYSARRSIQQMELTKSQLQSVGVGLQEQATFLKISGVLQKSTSIMKAMNAAMMDSNIRSTMANLTAEMSTAGLIQETIDKELSDMMPVNEDEVDDITEQVLWEVTAGMMGKAPPLAVGSSTTTGVAVAAGPVGAGGGRRVAMGANGELMDEIGRM